MSNHQKRLRLRVGEEQGSQPQQQPDQEDVKKRVDALLSLNRYNSANNQTKEKKNIKKNEIN